mmetsp:Transcript_46591/g.68437  ORF Transcript_46591/g.68437 Transcript_46591/m.68437 type:complete len:212 (+) Transcript_46591:2703-3338(+)
MSMVFFSHCVLAIIGRAILRSAFREGILEIFVILKVRVGVLIALFFLSATTQFGGLRCLLNHCTRKQTRRTLLRLPRLLIHHCTHTPRGYSSVTGGRGSSDKSLLSRLTSTCVLQPFDAVFHNPTKWHQNEVGSGARSITHLDGAIEPIPPKYFQKLVSWGIHTLEVKGGNIDLCSKTIIKYLRDHFRLSRQRLALVSEKIGGDGGSALRH